MDDQQHGRRVERMIGYPSHKYITYTADSGDGAGTLIPCMCRASVAEGHTHRYTTERVIESSSGQPAKGRNEELNIITIVLLGVTGAGKSTFASLASGSKDVEIGHGAKSCTQKPQAVNFELDGRPAVLIDTPGFDHDRMSDVRILQDIAHWMAQKGYAKDQRPDGLIFLHPMTHKTVGMSEWDRTRLVEKILGPDACRRVVFATTLWDELLTTQDVLKERLQGRISQGGVWHDMCRQGAKVRKHDNTIESAYAIVRKIIRIADREGPIDSLFHTEIRVKEGRFAETLVGKELEKRILDTIVWQQKVLKNHLADRPPDNYKQSKDPFRRRDWKRWQKELQELEKDLSVKRQELTKLRSIVIRFDNLHPSRYLWRALVHGQSPSASASG